MNFKPSIFHSLHYSTFDVQCSILTLIFRAFTIVDIFIRFRANLTFPFRLKTLISLIQEKRTRFWIIYRV